MLGKALGDFNARVGIFDPYDDLWYEVIGSDGIAEKNLADEESL